MLHLTKVPNDIRTALTLTHSHDSLGHSGFTLKPEISREKVSEIPSDIAGVILVTIATFDEAIHYAPRLRLLSEVREIEHQDVQAIYVYRQKC